MDVLFSFQDLGGIVIVMGDKCNVEKQLKRVWVWSSNERDSMCCICVFRNG